MTLINWDKPRKFCSTEEHNEMHQSDCGVPGTYVPNMSSEDMYSWKGKITGTRSGHPQVEIRRYPFLIIVSLKGGYKHKNAYTVEKTRNYNIHISTSGAIQLTFDQWEEMKHAVEEAKEKLQELEE